MTDQQILSLCNPEDLPAFLTMAQERGQSLTRAVRAAVHEAVIVYALAKEDARRLSEPTKAWQKEHKPKVVRLWRGQHGYWRFGRGYCLGSGTAEQAVARYRKLAPRRGWPTDRPIITAGERPTESVVIGYDGHERTWYAERDTDEGTQRLYLGCHKSEVQARKAYLQAAEEEGWPVNVRFIEAEAMSASAA
jgi:hypothetical protein